MDKIKFIIISLIKCLNGGMGDTRDLKSLGQKCPCEFESHLRY